MMIMVIILVILEYEYINGIWTQLGQDIDGEAEGDQSGRSVSLNADGTRVAIGAPSPEKDLVGPEYVGMPGYVRIYAWNGTSWEQVGQNIDGEVAYDESGHSVSLNADGSRVAISSFGNDGNPVRNSRGHVRIYWF